MERTKLKQLSKKEKDKIRVEFEKEIDFSKATRKGVFLNLDEDIIAYFKLLSKETGRGYQTLIQDALRYFKEKKLKPKTTWEEVG